MPFQSLNPATGILFAEFALTSTAEVETCLVAATEAAASWAALAVTQRASCLRAFADAICAQRETLAVLAACEMGKPLAQGRAEVEKCAATAHYFAEHGPEFLADEPLPAAANGLGRRFLTYAPVGVVLGVMPWNFPFWQVVRFAVPTLLAGNAVLIKHAPNVPQCAAALADIFANCFPSGLYADLRIEPATVANLLADVRIGAVSLTGSEQAGASVAAVAGQHLKPTVLELGGSDAFIVLADADVSVAATIAAKARLQNTGQSCIAAKRFIVEQPVYDEFLRLLAEHFRDTRGGDPSAPNADPDLTYGPLARVDLAEQLTEQVAKSVAAGAQVVVAGGQPSPESAFFHPMILTHVPFASPAWREELFGPVAVVQMAEDEAAAIRLANDSVYGLGAVVFTQDATRAERMARALQCGCVTINAMTASTAELPFGGRGRSGWGRELGALGARAFTIPKTIILP
jgi:succinate-semialdehyde dehydrogenase / glutarate-semialdehyde dehydrogenase